MAPDDADERYFARCTPWDLREGVLVTLNADGEVTNTLDGWKKLVFLQADGGRTVAEFIRMLKARPDLDAAGRPLDPTAEVMGTLSALVDDLHVVELRDVLDDLDPRHDLPLRER